MTVAPSAPAALRPAADEPAYRPFEVEVVRARRLSPSFLRMTFTGADLDQFGDTGFDQRIKLVLPAACGARVDTDLFAREDWHLAWRSMPDDERNPLRTYTVRAVRQAAREVDVDVVLHGVDPRGVTTRGCGLAELLGCACSGDAGPAVRWCAAAPAVRWCAAARAGDPIVLIGPNARYEGPVSGVEWRPPVDARTHVLAGDETAVPAVCAILERLPAGARAHAFLEVPTADDVLDLALPAGAEITWLPRSTGTEPTAPHGARLQDAVRAAVPGLLAAGAAATPDDVEDVDVDAQLLWEVPEEAAVATDGVYAWVAGEAAVVRDLRRFLVRDVGLHRTAVAFMGYWRTGRAEAA